MPQFEEALITHRWNNFSTGKKKRLFEIFHILYVYSFIKKNHISPLENANQLISKLLNEMLESSILCPHVKGNFMYQRGGYFWMRLTLKSLSKQMALQNVGNLKASMAKSKLLAADGLWILSAPLVLLGPHLLTHAKHMDSPAPVITYVNSS